MFSLTSDDLRGKTPDELDRLVAEIDERLVALHQNPDGSLRDKSRSEGSEFKFLLALHDEATERIDQARSGLAQFERGVGLEMASFEVPGARRDGPRAASTADRGDLLTREQSVEGWLRSRGQVRDDQRIGSFDRYLRALVAGAPYGADAEQRALSEGTLTAGGHLVPTPLAANVIDLARNQTKVLQAGAVTVPMATNTLKVPRLTSEGAPGWHAENAAITSADMVFDSVTFDAQTLTRLVVLSIELFEDSDPSAEGVIARSFAAQIALELDRAALRGSGTAPEPRGVLNTSGITTTTHGANGSVIGSPPAAGTMGWEFLVDSAAAVRNGNFEPNAQIMAPRLPQSLAKLRDTTNQYIAPPTYLDGIPRLQSKQVPINLTVGTSSDCSEVYTAQWDQLMIGIRTALRILPLRERFIDNGQYGFLAWLRADVQLAQPAAFVVDTGVRS